MTVVYSAIPYKTPWCLLGFLHGIILLAGVGATALLRWARRPVARVPLVLLLGAAVTHLAFQAYRGSYVYGSDSRNPYVYAHPTPEVFTVAEIVKEYAGLYDDPCDLTVQVACAGHDYWPLPWYLRFYNGGYSNALPDQVGPLIFVSEEMEGALGRRLYTEMSRTTSGSDRRSSSWDSCVRTSGRPTRASSSCAKPSRNTPRRRRAGPSRIWSISSRGIRDWTRRGTVKSHGGQAEKTGDVIRAKRLGVASQRAPFFPPGDGDHV